MCAPEALKCRIENERTPPRSCRCGVRYLCRFSGPVPTSDVDLAPAVRSMARDWRAALRTTAIGDRVQRLHERTWCRGERDGLKNQVDSNIRSRILSTPCIQSGGCGRERQRMRDGRSSAYRCCAQAGARVTARARPRFASLSASSLPMSSTDEPTARSPFISSMRMDFDAWRRGADRSDAQLGDRERLQGERNKLLVDARR